jgi:predicted metal-dependent hydrolase
VHTTRIQIGQDVPLRVIVPAGASAEYAAQALRNKATWVLDKLRVIEEARARPALLGLAKPRHVWLHGSAVPVVPAPVRYPRLENGELLLPKGGNGDALERWYRRTAGRWLRAVVAEEAARLGVDIASVGVRDQRTRWGSCSRHGNVSLNWRLVVAPVDVGRYVVVHELIHRQVPNHSKTFWRSLCSALPNWREASEWLERHGDELRRYAPSAALGES